MITDNTLVANCLDKLITYSWAEELRSFQETFEVEIQSQDDLDTWIRVCQEKGWTNHIFYSLMVLRSWLESEYDTQDKLENLP